MVRVHAGPQNHGGLAQLARATALHAVGQRFDSVSLHYLKGIPNKQKVCIEIETDDRVIVIESYFK